MVKFIHTADWQLGKNPHYLSDDARAQFGAARLEVVETIGRLAGNEGCDFVVVSGDVFESNHVSRQVLVRALDRMKAAAPVRFYLLPGNHDPLDAASIFCSPTFQQHQPSNVTILDGAGAVQAAPGVELIAAPWPNKSPLTDLVGDACERLAPADGLRVVCGHGAVDAIGPARNNPADISLQRLDESIESGVIHYAALGDRHSTTNVGSTGRVWYSGAPEPTDFTETDPGNVLVVSLDGGNVQVETRRVGTWRFERTDCELSTDADIEALEEWLAGMHAKDRTIARVGLRGQVSVAQKARLDDVLAHHRDLLACLDEDGRALAVLPDEADTDDFGLTGYAREALQDLFEMAEAGDRTAEARAALSLLYRLVGAGR